MTNRKLFQTIFIMTLIIISHCEKAKTYYQILGVKQNASEQDIKTQFKKLARKYHPDKIKGQEEKEKAEQRFMEIANAYETLIDKEKREQYDMELKYGKGAGNANYNNFQQRHQGQNYQDIFSSFFGGGGGFSFEDIFANSGFQRKENYKAGNQKQQGGFGGGGFGGGGFGGGDFGGHQQQQQQGQQKPFEDTNVIELNEDNISQFYQRKNVWIILLYSQNIDSSKEITVFQDIAKKGLEAFSMGAIRCDKKMNKICKEEFNYDENQAQIIGFPMSGGRNTQQNFNDKLNNRNVIEFAYSLIDNKVTIVNKTEQFFEAIAQINPYKQKAVLIFSDKPSASPLIKTIAEKYEKFFSFIQIAKTAHSVQKLFKVRSYPTILILDDITSFKGKVYEESQVNKQKISEFLDQDIKLNNRQSVLKLTPEFKAHQTTYFCGSDDKKICILMAQPTEQQLSDFQKLSQAYKDKPLRFIYSDGKINPEITEQQIIIYKSKRGNRYIECEIDSLNSCIDNVISGNSQFKSTETQFYDLIQ